MRFGSVSHKPPVELTWDRVVVYTTLPMSKPLLSFVGCVPHICSLRLGLGFVSIRTQRQGMHFSHSVNSPYSANPRRPSTLARKMGFSQSVRHPHRFIVLCEGACSLGGAAREQGENKSRGCPAHSKEQRFIFLVPLSKEMGFLLQFQRTPLPLLQQWVQQLGWASG